MWLERVYRTGNPDPPSKRGVRSLVIQEGVDVESLPLHVERSQIKRGQDIWLGWPLDMSPEVFWPCPTF